MHSTALAINVLLLLLKIGTGITVYRPVYLACLLMAPLQTGKMALAIINLVFLVVNSLADAVSHMDFSYRSRNPYSETLNINKVLHNFGFLALFCLFVSTEMA